MEEIRMMDVRGSYLCCRWLGWVLESRVVCKVRVSVIVHNYHLNSGSGRWVEV